MLFILPGLKLELIPKFIEYVGIFGQAMSKIYFYMWQLFDQVKTKG